MRGHFDEVIRKRSYEVFQYYLGSFYKNGRVVPGKNISNPFLLPHKQETPSFNVFRAYDDQIVYNDFATLDKGDCVSLAMKIGGFRTRVKAKEFIRYTILQPQIRKFNRYE